jgi:RHS repeat-associated protein
MKNGRGFETLRGRILAAVLSGAKALFLVGLISQSCRAAEDRYWQWAAARFGLTVASNPALRDSVWGENADPDHDNIPNLVEYAADTDPNSRTALSDVSSYQPTAGAIPASYPTLYMWQRTDDPDIAVVCQSSSDLVHWTPDIPSGSAPSNPALLTSETGIYRSGLRQMRYQDIFPIGARGAAFMRVVVVRRNVAAASPGLEPFSFTSQPAVSVGGLIRSNGITLSGFTGTITITVPAGVSLYVNGILQTGTTALVKAGDVLWMEAVAAAGAGVARDYVLSIGGLSATWSFTTAAIAPVPVQPGVASGYSPVQAGVSPTGGAQISLPITVSPGTGGMQPALALSYSSHQSTGPLGLGFSLSGLSSITRVGATIAQDGFKGGVAFNATDRFAFDGQRLIAINGNNGADGAEYCLEFDPGTRIHSYGADGNGPQRWTVEIAAGQILSLGQQTFARVKPEGSPSTLTWAVDKITDPLGNAMDITYDDTARLRGELLVTGIAYTSNAGQGLSAKQNVVFEYEDRPETVAPPVSSYLLADPGTFGQNAGFPSYWYFKIQNPVPGPYIYQFYITGDLAGSVGGGTPYTAESKVSTAAVHAGILTATQSGVVTIQNRPFNWPLNIVVFPGSTRNGVVSGNANSVQGTGFDFLTTFSAPQPQAPTSYVAGYPIRSLKRMKAIESKGTNASGSSARVRRYELTYQQDALTRDSQLIGVQEKLGDGTALPATTFSWPTSSAAETFLNQTIATTVPTSTNGDGDFLAVDFDGDDITDLLVWNAPGQANRYSFYRSNGHGFDALQPTSLTGDTNTRSHQVITGDFNADGKMDLLAWDQASTQYKMYLSTGTDFQAPISTGIPAGDTTHALWAADFNGDGRTDILAWNFPGHLGKYVLLLSQGNSFAAPLDTNITSATTAPLEFTNFTDGQNLCTTGEFNGDGKADLVLWNTTTAHYDLYLATGTGFAAPIATNVSSKFHPHAPNVVGDFNGDGLTDLMIWGNSPNSSAFSLFCATGAGFAAPIPTNVMGGADGSQSHYQFALDLNGDGKTDMITYSAPFGNNKLNIETSRGNVFNAAVTPTITGAGYYTLVGDFNGDGKTDMLVSTTTGTKPFNLLLNQGPAPRLIAKVTNGHGGYTKFSYKPLTDPGVHGRGSGAQYPSFDLQTSMYVVSSISSRNGIDGDPFTGAGADVAGENAVNYTYYGALSWLDGRGFQGFRTVLVYDVATGILTSTDYSADPLLSGRPVHSEQLLVNPPAGGSALISAHEMAWAATPTVRSGRPNTYLITQAGGTSKSYETNRPAADALVKTTVRSGLTYDVYGNLTHSLSDTEGFTEEVTNTYNNYTGTPWILGRLTASTVKRGAPGFPNITRELAFEYNASTGQRTSETIEPNGGSLRLLRTMSYDGFGNLLSTTLTAAGEPARTSTAAYSADGRFAIHATNPAGHAETSTYDPVRGLLLSRQSPNGLTTQWDYDAQDRPIRELRPGGTETRTAHRLVTGATTGAPPRAVHYVTAQSSGDAPRTVWYDLLDREIRSDEIGLQGQTISVHRVYDARGRTTGLSLPYFAGSTPLYSAFSYDGVGRPVREIAPGNRVSTTAYDGLTITRVNPSGQSVVDFANAIGQPVKTVDNLGDAITKSFDPFGNLRFATDSAGNTTEVRYDRRGNRVWMSDSDTGVTSSSYNAFGDVVSLTDAKGQTTAMTYDTLGRMTQRSEPQDGGTVASTFTFDTAAGGIGQPASEMGPGFACSFLYDSLSRPSGVVEAHGASVFAISRNYDQYGRPDAVTYPTGFSVRRTYSASGLLETVGSGGAPNTVYWRATGTNARGQILSERLGNGIETTRTYDPETGLVLSISGSGNVQNQDYTFDAVGNLTRRRDLRETTPFSETFGYDVLNRLTNVSTTGAPDVSVALNSIGNITSRSDIGTFRYATAAGPHALTSVTNGGAFNKSCAHDANGNRISDGGTSISYSGANQPVRISKGSDSLRFDYTPSRRFYRQTLFHSETNSSTQKVREYVGNLYEREVSSEGVARHTHYITGGNGVIAIYTDERSATPGTRLRYLHRNYLGSIDAVTDNTGAVMERLNFDAWGRRRNVTYSGGGWQVDYPANPGAVETHHGFTGHDMLDSVGLVHMRGRIYDPVTARFLSPDPLIQAPDNEQSFNRYSYVWNNASSFTDPSGFEIVYTPMGTVHPLYTESSLLNSSSSGMSAYSYSPTLPSIPVSIFLPGDVRNYSAYSQTVQSRGTATYTLSASFPQAPNITITTNSSRPITVTRSRSGGAPYPFSSTSVARSGVSVVAQGLDGAAASSRATKAAYQGLQKEFRMQARAGQLRPGVSFSANNAAFGKLISAESKRAVALTNFAEGLGKISLALDTYKFMTEGSLESYVDMTFGLIGIDFPPAALAGNAGKVTGMLVTDLALNRSPIGALFVDLYGRAMGWDEDTRLGAIGGLVDDGYFGQ